MNKTLGIAVFTTCLKFAHNRSNLNARGLSPSGSSVTISPWRYMFWMLKSAITLNSSKIQRLSLASSKEKHSRAYVQGGPVTLVQVLPYPQQRQQSEVPWQSRFFGHFSSIYNNKKMCILKNLKLPGKIRNHLKKSSEHK